MVLELVTELDITPGIDTPARQKEEPTKNEKAESAKTVAGARKQDTKEKN